MYVTNELNNLRGGQVELNGIIPIHIIHTDMDFKKELISNMVKVVSHFTYPDIYIYIKGRFSSFLSHIQTLYNTAAHLQFDC